MEGNDAEVRGGKGKSGRIEEHAEREKAERATGASSSDWY